MKTKIDAKSVVIGLLLGVVVVTTMGQGMGGGALARSVLITHDEQGGAYVGYIREDNQPFFVFLDKTTWRKVEEAK